MSDIFQKQGVTGVWLGREFAKVVALASARGTTAIALGIMKQATLGIRHAQNSVERKVTRGIKRNGVQLPAGIEYFVGRGSPIGGYPGNRTGRLERSIAVQSAKPARQPKAFTTADVQYAASVHGFRDGSPKRPYLTLPIESSKRTLRDMFAKAFIATMTEAGLKLRGQN